MTFLSNYEASRNTLAGYANRMLAPSDLGPVLPLNPIGDVAAESMCPRCGATNDIKWDTDGTLVWWATSEHCSHYQGAYSTGVLSTVQVFYK